MQQDHPPQPNLPDLPSSSAEVPNFLRQDFHFRGRGPQQEHARGYFRNHRGFPKGLKFFPERPIKWSGGVVSTAPPGGGCMIQLTRLNKQPLLVNSDLIKYVEHSPDTLLTLIGGDKIVVRETSEEVLERIVAFRRRVLEGLVPPGTAPDASNPMLPPDHREHADQG
jgi:flagellar protein FlbD